MILSFIAGLETKTISKWIVSKNSMLRIMPNIFISSNNSSTAVYAKKVNTNIKNKIVKDFGEFGDIIWMKKRTKNRFLYSYVWRWTSILFYILNCFNKIIKKNGFTERQSLSAIKLLLKGVLENINKENFKFSDSIQKVASKGGTTEEGLKVLSKKNNLFMLFEKAIYPQRISRKRISKKLK